MCGTGFLDPSKNNECRLCKSLPKNPSSVGYVAETIDTNSRIKTMFAAARNNEPRYCGGRNFMSTSVLVVVGRWVQRGTRRFPGKVNNCYLKVKLITTQRKNKLRIIAAYNLRRGAIIFDYRLWKDYIPVSRPPLQGNETAHKNTANLGVFDTPMPAGSPPAPPPL